MYGTASNPRPFVATGPPHSFRIRSSWLELHAPRLPVVAMGLRDQARPTGPRLSQPLPSFHGPRPGGSDARMLGSGAHGHGCGMDVDRSTNCGQARRLASIHLREFLLDPLRRVCTDGPLQPGGSSVSTWVRKGIDRDYFPGRKGRKRMIGSRLGGRGRAIACGCQPREHCTCAWTHRRTPTSSIGWTCSSECGRRAARIVDASEIGTGCVHGRDSNRG